MTNRPELTCAEMSDLLPLAAGQDVDDAQSRAVWGHLAACVPCRVEYSEFLGVRSRLRSLEPSGAAVESLPAGFFAELQRDTLVRVGTAAPVRARWPIWTGLAAAACLLGIALTMWDQPAGMLDRSPLGARAARPSADYLTPLAYPAQGLGAHAQVERLLGPGLLVDDEVDVDEPNRR